MKYGDFKKIKSITDQIMEILKKCPLPLNKISKQLGKQDPTTIYHLQKLEGLGKVEKKRVGKEIYYGLVKNGK